MWQLLLGALGLYATIWFRWRFESARWAPPPAGTTHWRDRHRGRAARPGPGPSRLRFLPVPFYWVCLTACAVLLAHGLVTLLAN